MRRLVPALVTAAVAIGLVGLVPTSAAAETCDDPDHPFTALPLDSSDLSVGIGGDQVVRFAVRGPDACLSNNVLLRLTTPRQEILVHLDQEDEWVDGVATYYGIYVVDPVLLRNPDAGTWTADYLVDGTPYGTTTLQVRRATRVGLEARRSKHRTTTFTGRVERADWEWRAWRAYGRKKVSVARVVDGQAPKVVATAKTRHSGRFTVRKRVPRTATYQAAYAGNATSVPSTSDVETVR